MARSMESLTTIAMQQQDAATDGDDNGRTLDRLASFAAISDTSITSKRRMLQRKHLMTARRQSLPDTIDDIRKADAYVMSRLNFKFLTPTWRRFYDRLSLSLSLSLSLFVCMRSCMLACV